jgi:predicted transglutaminase-like cysteine proteinase
MLGTARQAFLIAASLLWSSITTATDARDYSTEPANSREIIVKSGEVATVELNEAATRVVLINASVAEGHIVDDTLLVIRAKAAGTATATVLSDKNTRTVAVRIVVQPQENQPSSVGALNSGPSLDHTPTKAEITSLMGPRFMAASLGAFPSAGLPQRSERAITFEQTRPPLGWRQFCSFYPSECTGSRADAQLMTLNETSWRQLVAINRAVNRRIAPVSDMEHRGVVEHWDYPMDGKGDCEDYALLKRRLLIEAGWPRQALLMTVVRDKRGDGHAVLTVITDRGDLVLDNQNPRIVNWVESGYRYIKRQSAEDPNVWVSLKSPEPAMSDITAQRSHAE